jgi:CRISPR-associated protein Csd1
MLLKRLVDHATYVRELPPPFYRIRSIRWAIHLDRDGTPMTLKLMDLASKDRVAGVPMPAPYIVRSGQRPPAMLLVDDLRYVTAYSGSEDSRTAGGESERRNGDYVALLARWRDSAPDDPAAQAVMSFFGKGLHRKLPIPPEAKPTDVVGIMIGDDEWAHRRDSAIGFWGQVTRERKGSANTGICLVCGQPGSLLDTIPEAIKAGAIPAGTGRGRDAQLASVNKPAQGRGGRIQLASAPVCDQCGSSAMSVLNALLADNSSRYQTADSVMTWWLKQPRPYPWIDWVNNPQPAEVARLIASLHQPGPGAGAGTISPNAFYAVTLSANQSRAVVRDWLDVPLGRIEGNLGRWFADHRISYRENGAHPASLWLMAVSTGRWGSENGQEKYLAKFMPHGCERDLMLTALRGTRPPGYLLPHLLRRVRADGRIDHPRAALLRLILVRSRDGDIEEENYMAGLDPDIPKPSYQCGRMFAVLDEIQRAALGSNINTTIADKYLAAATVTPLAILTMLHKNADGHMKRLRRTSRGAHTALGARLDDVMARLDGDTGIPGTLDLAGQAEFIIGYHHQRAADIAAARARAERNKGNSTDDDGDSE